MNVFIYALNCPVSGKTRYVGKTNNPDKRLAAHLRSKERDHRGNWIRSVLATGEKPILEVLDEVSNVEWPSWEVAYIQFFRDEGCDLVNATCGGEGVEMTLEIRAKLSAANLGKQLSAEHCAKIGAAGLGRKHSPETRAKISAAKSGDKNPFFGKKHSAEHRAKISAAESGEKNHNFGKKLSAETRAKMSAAGKKREKHSFFGKKHSAETKAKMSAARKLYWEKRKV